MELINPRQEAAQNIKKLSPESEGVGFTFSQAYATLLLERAQQTLIVNIHCGHHSVIADDAALANVAY